MSYDGNLAALEAHDRADDEWLDSRPLCSVCKQPIQEPEAYDTEEGLMCEFCAQAHAEDMAEEQIRDWMEDWKTDTERYVE